MRNNDRVIARSVATWQSQTFEIAARKPSYKHARKLSLAMTALLSAICYLSAPAHANPATLSVLVSSTLAPAQVTTSTVTVDVGTTSVLGAADFTLTFDTHVVSANALTPLAANLQNNFFFNPGSLAQGQVRIVALNGASTVSPSGLVSLSSMSLTAVGAGGSSTTVNAQVNLLVDTQTIAYSPVTVVPGSITILTPDNLPPVTQILYSTPSYINSASQVYLSTVTILGFVATDTGSGVAFTHYAVDSGTFTLYASPFTLPEGLHVIRYQSQDHAGNLEVARSTDVYVDGTPPVTALVISSSPAGSGGGSMDPRQRHSGVTTLSPALAVRLAPNSFYDP